MCTEFVLTATAQSFGAETRKVQVEFEVKRLTDVEYEDLGDEGCLALAQELCDDMGWDYIGFAVVEAVEPIPQGVVWSRTYDDFVDVETRHSMGSRFLAQWVYRAAEFPAE